MLTETQRDDLASALSRTYFSRFDPAYKATEAFKRDMSDHLDGRYTRFANCVLPWLRRHVSGLEAHIVVEVGSGTGSSTAAIAKHVRRVVCFEIDDLSIAAAKSRAEVIGYNNATQQQAVFNAAEAAKLGPVDGVFLAAVLEHCTFEECLELLGTAWRALKAGGWLCVVDTPNRLCPIDHHTSLLPFFATLPIEARLAYARRSPRAQFARDFATLSDEARLRMVRWGSGISYHELELAIGEDIHQRIVADGWEPEINSALGILPEDLMTELQLKTFAPQVHRAFARRDFYLIARKVLTP